MSFDKSVGAGQRLMNFAKEFSINHKSPSMESKYVSEDEIDITKTVVEEPSNNEPPSSEVRFAMEYEPDTNRPGLLFDDKPLLKQGPLATIGKEEGATVNKFFNERGLDMAKGLKFRDPGNAPNAGSAEEVKNKQGCWFGVFFPVLQNILGVLLFIRVPIITGKAGISASIVIVGLACATTFFTVLSTAAIATNGKIKLGGSYYLISRSLGPPSGGSVGILFYLGTTFAGAMYILGAVEAVLISFFDEPILGDRLMDMRIFGMVVLAFLVFVAWVGLSFAAKLGIVFLGVVIISILCMYIGCFTVGTRHMNNQLFLTGLSGESFAQNWPFKASLQQVFGFLAIYFPSVTGIMAGANRSGDLANPSRAIPVGSLAAQTVTTFIYISFPILFGAIATQKGLEYEDWLFTAEISWPHHMVVRIGIIMSSVGAGLQTIVGAPRILQAVANDKLIPVLNCFAVNVTRPLFLTGGICFLAVMIGDIDVVTPIITMFFLLCYGYVNIACFLLQMTGSLNWRPKWKCYHWITALLGMLLCGALMFMISWYSAIISIVLLLLLYVYIDKRSSDKDWGDSIEGMKAQRARDALLKVNRKRRDHVKNWRPHVLAIGSLNINLIEQEVNEERQALLAQENGQLNNIAEQEPVNHAVAIPDQTPVARNKKKKCCKRVKKSEKERQALYEEKQKERELLEKPYIQERGLLDFMHMMKKNTGLAIYGACFPGAMCKENLTVVARVEERLYRRFTEERRRVITKIILGDKENSCDSFLVQGSGMGGLEPNTVLLKWPENWSKDRATGERFVNILKLSRFSGRMSLVLKPEVNFIYEYGEGRRGRKKKISLEGTIDIWSFTYESGTQLLFAFILKKAKYWRKCKVRLFTVTGESNPDFQKTMKQFLKDVRLDQLVFEMEEVVVGHDAVAQFTIDLEKQLKQRQLPEEVMRMDSLAQLNAMDRDALAIAKQRRQEKARKISSQVDEASGMIEESKGLNQTVLERSADAQLVIMNMPEISAEQTSAEYLQFMDILTKGLNRVLMIKNTGKEVITEYT